MPIDTSAERWSLCLRRCLRPRPTSRYAPIRPDHAEHPAHTNNKRKTTSHGLLWLDQWFDLGRQGRQEHDQPGAKPKRLHNADDDQCIGSDPMRKHGDESQKKPVSQPFGKGIGFRQERLAGTAPKTVDNEPERDESSETGLSDDFDVLRVGPCIPGNSSPKNRIMNPVLENIGP